MNHEECQHVMIFEDTILLTDPPIQRWICERCGLEGISYMKKESSRYNEIKRKFKEPHVEQS